MGERGPKPEIVQKLTPSERRELDQAIVEGSETKADLFKRFAEQHGIGYRAFCKYATALEGRARHRYVGELLTKVFGNLPDSEIDLRARGIMAAMLDRIAADVLHDGELKPKDLRHVVQAYDTLRRASIAEATEERRQAEWGAARLAGVAEAAVLIKDAVSEELSRDTELCERIQQAIDASCGRIDKPKDHLITTQLLEKYAAKSHWSGPQRAVCQALWDINLDERAGKPKPPPAKPEDVKRLVLDHYGVRDDDTSEASNE